MSLDMVGAVHIYARHGKGARWYRSRDDLLSAYEQGVWTFLFLFGLAVVGFVVWLGYMVL